MSVWKRWADGLDNPIVVKEGVSRMRTWRAPVVATLYLGLIGAVGYAWLNIGEAANQFASGRPHQYLLRAAELSPQRGEQTHWLHVMSAAAHLLITLSPSGSRFQSHVSSTGL